MQYFIKNQPWNTKADSERFLRSHQAIEWNLWKQRQPPLTTLAAGDRVVLARGNDRSSSRLDWVVEVSKVARGEYRNLAQSFDIMQTEFPREMKAIGATRRNWATRWEYNQNAPRQGHLLAFTMKPLQFLDVARDRSLTIRPNGWLTLTEDQYRGILRADTPVTDPIKSVGDTMPAQDVTADEGDLRMRTHMRRERDPHLVRAKKDEVLHRTGRLDCEVCGFNFLDFYGALGEGFIECHHLRPLASTGPIKTSLQDLALVCSNCHSMLHRSATGLTPELLRRVASGV